MIENAVENFFKLLKKEIADQVQKGEVKIVEGIGFT